MTELIIKILATGSSGNCYHLKYGDNELLIEAGIPVTKIKTALGFKLSNIDGCLCSHHHGDHAKYINDLTVQGVDCYMTWPTASKIGARGHRAKVITPLEQFKIGFWNILPFETEHDCDGCVGFLIRIGNEKILFATDTAYIHNTFKGLTKIMVECNYSEGLIVKNVRAKDLHYAQMKRTLQTHFGLQNVVSFLRESDLEIVKEVVLIHLSNSNADEKLIRNVVEQAVGPKIKVVIP